MSGNYLPQAPTWVRLLVCTALCMLAAVFMKASILQEPEPEGFQHPTTRRGGRTSEELEEEILEEERGGPKGEQAEIRTVRRRDLPEKEKVLL